MIDYEEPTPLALEMWPALPGVALAGGLYAVIGVLLLEMHYTHQGFALAFFYAVIIGPLGFVYGFFTGAVAMIVTSSFLWSTGLNIKKLQSGSLAGGLAGYWSIAVAFIVITNGVAVEGVPRHELIIFTLLGPVTAMTVGYVGARLYMQYGWRLNLVSRAVSISKQAEDHQRSNKLPEFQLNLRNLFGLIVWVALLSAFVQATGPASRTLWTAIAIYTIAQCMVVAIDVALRRGTSWAKASLPKTLQRSSDSQC